MEVDVAIVGGSFAGLAAALQLVRARRRVLLIDAGRPRNHMADAMHGMPGQDGRAPGAVLADLRDELGRYRGLTAFEGEAVGAATSDGGFAVSLPDGTVATAPKLILATGVTDALPEVPGLAERWGRSVFHCLYCHGFEVAGSRIAVLGALPESVVQALVLPDWSPSVTLFPDGRVALPDDSRSRLAARAIAIDETPVVAIEGPGTAVEALHLADGRRVGADVVFTLSRTLPASGLAERLGCRMAEGAFGPLVATDDWRQTSVPGVYAAGDMARAFQTATLAMADGLTAAVGAHHALVLD